MSQSSPLPQSARRFYRPELDVLRAIAFLLVFFHHLLPPSPDLVSNSIRNGCALGVCLFFFLSSYLITELLNLEIGNTGTIRLRAFYMRRILRVWPLYFLVLFADFLIPHPLHPKAFTAARLAANLLLLGNWFVARHGFSFTYSMPLWSISVEEQFYVLWPTARKHLRRSRSVALAILTFLLSYVALARLCQRHSTVDTGIWVNSFVQFQFFSLGALLAFLLKLHSPRLNIPSRLGLFAAGLLAFFVAQAVFHVKESPGPTVFRNIALGYLCTALGCVLLFLSFLGATSLVRVHPLLYLGKISYGLYVFHEAALTLSYRLCARALAPLPHLQHLLIPLDGLVGFAITLTLASLSYRFFERPILRFKNRFEVIRTRVA